MNTQMFDDLSNLSASLHLNAKTSARRTGGTLQFSTKCFHEAWMYRVTCSIVRLEGGSNERAVIGAARG